MKNFPNVLLKDHFVIFGDLFIVEKWLKVVILLSTSTIPSAGEQLSATLPGQSGTIN